MMSGAGSPGSAGEALGMLRSAMGYLAAADATAMAAETQAQCLQVLEQVNSMGTAARASILAAFTAGQGYSADADYSPAGMADPQDPHHQGRRGRRTPRGRGGPPRIRWSRGAGGRGDVGVLRPDDLRLDRQAARRTAARTRMRSWRARRRRGMDLADLAGLAGEIYARSRPEDPAAIRTTGSRTGR